jgi:nucleoside diphosphate kinase
LDDSHDKNNTNNPVYKNIVNCINSFSVINGVAAYESFIRAHNKLIGKDGKTRNVSPA